LPRWPDGDHQRGCELVVLDRAVGAVEGALATDANHEAVRAHESQPVVVEGQRRGPHLGVSQVEARVQEVPASVDVHPLGVHGGEVRRGVGEVDRREAILVHEAAQHRVHPLEDACVVDGGERRGEERARG
jgi:hypothetical protein